MRVRIIFLSILTTFFLFVFLEFVARTIPVKDDLLNKIFLVLEQDRDLLWKQRSNLNVTFEGTRVETNSFGIRSAEIHKDENNNVFRIICLGASPTFGWGVEVQDAYPAQLNALLMKVRILKRKVEVINAGQIGYSSFQGIRFIQKYILGLKPDLLVVSYVVNDVDKYRFFRSNGLPDNRLGPAADTVVLTENILQRSRFYNLFKRMIFATQSLVSHGNDMKIIDSRVSQNDYAANIDTLIDIAEKNKIKILYITAPVGDLNFVHDKHSEILECLNQIGTYNQIMRKVAQKRGVPCLDIVPIFNIQQERNASLFVNPAHDFVHPNIAGHRLIAMSIYDELLKDHSFFNK